jgi:hypothetical protein
MTPAQARVLAALRDGAVMTWRGNSYPVLEGPSHPAQPVRCIQRLFEAGFVRLASRSLKHVILTPTGRAALLAHEAQA